MKRKGKVKKKKRKKKGETKGETRLARKFIKSDLRGPDERRGEQNWNIGEDQRGEGGAGGGGELVKFNSGGGRINGPP